MAGPKKLSRELVLRAALQLVDREGLDAISMRRLGETLGVEAMSLYNHIADKADLLDGVFETVLGELPRALRQRTWQATVRERAHSLRAVLAAHPNALPLFASRPAVTPASLRHVEEAFDVLRSHRFSPRGALTVFQTMVAYVVGHTLATFAPASETTIASPRYDALDAATFPRVKEVAKLLGTRDLDEEFSAGLEAMIAGFDTRRG